MLKNRRKEITLNYTSYVEGVEDPIMDLSARIPSETAIGDVNQYVRNQNLYNTHRAEMRRDLQEFQDEVWAIEDQVASEMPVPEEAPEPIVEG